MNVLQLGSVYTEGGTVQGTSYSVGNLRYMDVFKGIPFAAPPGRLQKPVPHPGWGGEYTCLFRCFQAQLESKISECIDSALLLTLPAQVF